MRVFRFAKGLKRVAPLWDGRAFAGPDAPSIYSLAVQLEDDPYVHLGARCILQQDISFGLTSDIHKTRTDSDVRDVYFCVRAEQEPAVEYDENPRTCAKATEKHPIKIHTNKLYIRKTIEIFCVTNRVSKGIGSDAEKVDYLPNAIDCTKEIS